MAKEGERSVGATRFGEGFVWESKETRDDDRWWMGRTQYEGGQCNSTMSGKQAYVWCHGWRVYCSYMVEVGEPVYVQAPHK